MKHKQRCIAYCMEYLELKNLKSIFDLSLFNHYYRKHGGAWANAYMFGLSAADFIINNTKQA